MASIIKIDYDMPMVSAKPFYLDRFHLLNDILGFHFVGFSEWSESNGGNTHVVLTLKEDLLPLEILAVQLIMGSDPVREAFNLRRIRRGQKNWNILFKPKRRLL